MCLIGRKRKKNIRKVNTKVICRTYCVFYVFSVTFNVIMEIKSYRYILFKLDQKKTFYSFMIRIKFR